MARVARGQPLVVAGQGGIVGLQHPDSFVALGDLGGVDGLHAFDLGGVPRLILLPLGLQFRDPVVRRGQLPALFVQILEQALVLGDNLHELFAHDDQVRPCQGGAAHKAPI